MTTVERTHLVALAWANYEQLLQMPAGCFTSVGARRRQLQDSLSAVRTLQRMPVDHDASPHTDRRDSPMVTGGLDY